MILKKTILWTLLAAAGIFVVPLAPAAQTCPATCSITDLPATVPQWDWVSFKVHLRWPQTCPWTYCYVESSENNWSQTGYGDGGASFTWSTPGEKTIHLVVADNSNRSIIYCETSATITVLPCTLSRCSVSVDHIEYMPNGLGKVYFKISGPDDGCGTVPIFSADVVRLPGEAPDNYFLGNGPRPFLLPINYGPQDFGSFQATFTIKANNVSGVQPCTTSCQVDIPGPSCQLDCTATVPASGTAGSSVAFAASATPVSCTGNPSYSWAFGDGQTSAEQNPSHVYYDTGDYPWTLTVSLGGKTCTKSGTISISNCTVGCSVTVPGTATVGTPVNFTGTATATGCTGDITYAWDFGDSWTSTLQSPSHTYAETGTFNWSMTAKAGGVECKKSGSITVGCLTVGQLAICSDEVSKSGDTYTFTGDVDINNMLFFTGSVTFTGNPASGSGKLSTDGNIFVELSKGDETLLKGPGLVFDVDGTGGKLFPRLADPKFTYAGGLGGVPIYVSGLPITFATNGVQTESIFYIGIPDLFTIATAKAVQLYPSDGERVLLSAEVVAMESSIAPSVKFLSMSLTYDPKTDKLEGKISVGFPFFDKMWGVDLAVRVVQGCFNGLDLSVPLLVALPLGTSGLELAAVTVKMDNICVGQFTIFLGGDLKLVGTDPVLFVIKDAGIQYYYPLSLEVKAGTANVFGYPMAEASGRANLNSYSGTFFVKANVVDFVQGDIRFSLIAPKKWFMGRFFGRVQIPDFQCAWTSVTCRSLRTLITSMVPLPYVIDEQYLELNQQILEGNKLEAFYRGLVSFPVIGKVAFLAEVRADGTRSVFMGRNMENLYEVTESAPAIATGLESAERPLVLTQSQESVTFSAAADAIVPSIYLKTPDGDTITPANVSGFAGVTYASSDTEKVALFCVSNAKAGTWILGADNLSAGQVTFEALAAKAPPATTFTAVNRSGDSVSISASVAPAGEHTKVGLYYSRVADGSVDGVIAENLPASTGSVSATWDTSGLPTGSYYILAIADDSMNPPTTATYQGSVVIDNGRLQPPTELTGTRSASAGTATLSWKPSSSTSATSYEVRYTADPNVPGYPLSFTPEGDDGATILGLDATKSYKFAVVAFDGEGNCSAESNSVTLAKPSGKPGDCDGNETVSIGEVQKVINMFLGLLPPGCNADANGDGVIGIGELQQVINAFLGIAPGVSVSVSPQTATLQPGGTRQFTATVSGTTNTAVTWSVVEGASGGTVTQGGLYTAPQSPGTYHVKATSQADQTKSGTASVTVQGGTCGLTCSASANPNSGNAPLAVNFSATATATNCSGGVTYSWNFGDGASSAQQNPSHTYTSTGTYSWSMTASAGGQTCTKSGNISVTYPPTCTITCSASANPNSGNAPLSVNFTATATATNCSGGVAYAWSFGDGASSSQQNPSHTYTSAGTYGWSMTASAGGQNCSKSGSITVSQASDVALSDGVPYSDTLSAGNWKYYYIDVPDGKGLTADLYDMTADADLYIGIGYKPTKEQNDCHSFHLGTAAENCVIPPGHAGRYWIGVYSSAAASYKVKATLSSTSCSISCMGFVYPLFDMTVSFDATVLSNTCTSQPTFLWEFGDGQTSALQTGEHTYGAAGNYTWTVTVSADGATCQQTGQVRVGG